MSSLRFLLLVFASLAYLHHFSICSVEFQVGDSMGWVVPQKNESGIFYNNWASRQRFRVGDTVRFKYKKDSVLEVAKEDYQSCNSTRPNYFNNRGNTVIELDHSGSYYFISGVHSHCLKGLKMIAKVLSNEDEDDSAASHNPEEYHRSSAALLTNLFGVSLAVVLAPFVLLSFHASY